jgi:hypothetical protein
MWYTFSQVSHINNLPSSSPHAKQSHRVVFSQPWRLRLLLFSRAGFFSPLPLLVAFPAKRFTLRGAVAVFVPFC